MQAAHTTQCQKNKQPNQKVGERPKQKTYRWLTNTWKDAQHHSLLENANQKYNELSPHTSQNGHHKKIHKQVLKRVWRNPQ